MRDAIRRSVEPFRDPFLQVFIYLGYMRNVLIALQLLIGSLVYGQSELREIRTGDMFLYTSDSTSPVSFSYQYPKSFRVKQVTSGTKAVIFYRYNTAMLNIISVYKKTTKRMDSALLYSDTTTIRHYHTSWHGSPHDKTEDSVTINGRLWKSIEFEVEAEMKNGKTMYDKERIYRCQVGDYVVSVLYVISLDTNAQQTAKVFDAYKDVFATEMKTLLIKE